MNGDGNNDVVFGAGAGGAQLLLGNGQGGFASIALTTTALGVLTAVDVDRDGDLDIVSAESGVDRVIENR